MQIFATILSAVVVFILSQFFLELVLKPLKKYKKAEFLIDSELKFYANRLSSPDVLSRKEELIRIVDTIRNLSCELEASYKQVIGHWFFKKIDLIPDKGEIENAASILIRVSNNVGMRDPVTVRNYEDVKEIRKLLNIESLSN